MADEGFHEIQLNGKQLVFLFMAVTVVAVVIFLSGVMVGRGVPTRAASAIDASGQANRDPTAAVQAPPAAPALAGTGRAPATTQEDLSYPALLRDSDPPVDTLRPPVEPRADVPPVGAPRTVAVPPASAAPRQVAPALPPVAAASPAGVAPRLAAVAPLPAPPSAVTPRPVAAAGALGEPRGNGFVVQVAAVRQRAEANTIARRLSTKGYPAFVTTVGANFRVRVGKYDDRREAESVAGRLEQEEQFKPWITR